MAGGCSKSARFLLGVSLALMSTVSLLGQQSLDTQEVPTQFKLDMETAARLRKQLAPQSTVASGRYTTGRLVFDRLVDNVTGASAIKFAWQLRIIDNDHLNAYASPEGTVYVESGLAQLAGPSTGLWAAVLSHEIAHVLRRDWARRYLLQKSLAVDGGGGLVLGDPGLPASGWTDPQKAAQDMARFSRRLEVEADHDGLTLMARAGYHPDFVPALHHLLHARGLDAPAASLYAMHPCWEERDHELDRAYVAASIDFDRRWPEWFASPGGNPPTVVFAGEPMVKRNSAKDWEIQIPMRCQNLAGAVEVVLRASSLPGKAARLDLYPEFYQPVSENEVRQLTGCTSPKTTIVFNLAELSARLKSSAQWTDVFVLDAWGSVLARADIPKLPR